MVLSSRPMVPRAVIPMITLNYIIIIFKFPGKQKCLENVKPDYGVAVCPDCTHELGSLLIHSVG
jgi:hypothetical protein